MVLPEIVRQWGHPDMQALEKVYDAHVVTADFLIRNIDPVSYTHLFFNFDDLFWYSVKKRVNQYLMSVEVMLVVLCL